MKPSLPLVSFEVTMKCNLKCKYCYNYHKANNIQPTQSNYNLAYKALIKLFQTFKIGQITFTGGEPFLGERFTELVLAARLRGAKVSVISNGNYAPIKKYLQLTKLGVEVFELPIHSYNPEIHDFMTGCKGSHKKSINTITSLIQNGSTPVAVVVITKYNADEAAKTIRYIASLGIKRIMLNRYNIGGESINNIQNILPSLQQLKNAYRNICNELKTLSISIYSSVCTPFCILNPKDYLGINFSTCSTNISTRPIVVDYLGNVRFCNHSPINLGNIFNDTAQTILESEELKKWATIIPPYCKDCQDYSICKGGCRAASQQCGQTIEYPDPIINYYKKNCS